MQGLETSTTQAGKTLNKLPGIKHKFKCTKTESNAVYNKFDAAQTSPSVQVSARAGLYFALKPKLWNYWLDDNSTQSVNITAAAISYGFIGDRHR